jgi:hypothetical protein
VLDIKWGQNIYEVALLYFKVAFVYSAYFGTKIFIAQNRPSLNPPHQAVTTFGHFVGAEVPRKSATLNPEARSLEESQL